VFLGRATGVAEAACLLRPAPVVSRRAFAEAPPASNDVLTCDYLYDEAAQARAAPGTEAAGAPPGARRPPWSSSQSRCVAHEDHSVLRARFRPGMNVKVLAKERLGP